MRAIKSNREQRILSLARQIAEVLRKHPDRLEALDAMSMARILFREGSTDLAGCLSPSLRVGVQQSIP